MCTLIIARDVLGPGSLLIGANRDEDPARVSEAPLRLAQHVVGGRDLVGGGTWLAIRDGRSVVAVLNRRGSKSTTPPGSLRSRGMLALDVACTAPGVTDDEAFARAALTTALTALSSQRYAPFSLACVTPAGGWVLPYNGVETTNPLTIEPGWHVLTHGDLDDAAEPRTLRLARKLVRYQPHTTGEAETKVLELLSLHGTYGEGTPPPPDAPEDGPAAADRAAVCIHEGRMVTVSTSLFRLSRAGARYIHIEGRPCTTPPRDVSSLLTS